MLLLCLPALPFIATAKHTVAAAYPDPLLHLVINKLDLPTPNPTPHLYKCLQLQLTTRPPPSSGLRCLHHHQAPPLVSTSTSSASSSSLQPHEQDRAAEGKAQSKRRRDVRAEWYLACAAWHCFVFMRFALRKVRR